MNKIKSCLQLFLTMFKIGLFTFGGGYAMISVVEREVVERKKWLNHDEFIDIIAIAESTPGPHAVNTSTFIGYKRAGVLGAVFATTGAILPSLIIIFCISLFFDKFMQLTYVRYAFYGISSCVVFLILNAGIKLFKSVKINVFNTVVASIVTALMITFSLLSIAFSSIYFILIGGAIGLTIYFMLLIVNGKRIKKDKNVIRFDSGKFYTEEVHLTKVDEEPEKKKEGEKDA